MGSLEAEIASVRERAECLYTAAEVADAIAAMAERIDASLAAAQPVVLALMRGGAFTAVRLCEHFRFPYEFDYIDAGRYADRLTGREVVWRVRPRPDLAGRAVLLVDDVLDQGVTLEETMAALESLPVASLHVAVLVEKQVNTRARRRPDFCAFETGDRYLFGCGMDYKGYWRGLPALYAIDADV